MSLFRDPQRLRDRDVDSVAKSRRLPEAVGEVRLVPTEPTG